jgi:ubiquinone/menaquinone biosynthesis C-methylase UbiE
MVESYDSLIRRAVSRYDEMTERLLIHLPPGSRRILELGCGTGNLTLKLAERFPEAEIMTVDASPEMAATAAARAAAKGFGGRVRTVTGRFEETRFAPGSFDLVTSCMSLHHVKEKGPLYRSIRGWLAPGGWFCFADQLLGVTEEVQRVMWEEWLKFCRANCSEEEVKSLLEHAAAHDHYEPLAAHFRMMAEAGYGEMDCVWRNLMYSVVVGRC